MDGNQDDGDVQDKNVSGNMIPDESRLDMFAELDAIDNIGDMTYHEKHAFNLEHLASITCLIHIRMPNFMSLIDLNKNLGQMPAAQKSS